MGEKLTFDQLDFLRRERLALSKLTAKQKAFCESYCRTLNKLEALQAGGYWLPKWNGSRQAQLIERKFAKTLESAAVQEYIMLLRQSLASRMDVSLDALIEEYKNIALANMDDYVSWTADGVTLVSSEELTRAQKAGILEVTETTTKSGTTVKIKLHNKQTALDKLFEILKELETMDEEKEAPLKISQTQINFILQDPVKRRAVEHLAESLFEKRVRLVGTDRDRLEFDKNLEKITTKLLERAHGKQSQGGVGQERGAQNTEAVRVGVNATDYQGPDSSAAN